MKKLSIVIASLLLVTLSANVMAQASSSTVGAQASATIVNPIVITKVSDLQFGLLAAGSSTGTAILTPANGLSKTGGITIVSTNAHTVPTYTVTGATGAAYTITLPADNIVKLTSAATGAVDMKLTGFNTSLGANSTLANQILTNGSVSFSVGATLNVNENQVAGTYTGSYDVTVAYN